MNTTYSSNNLIGGKLKLKNAQNSKSMLHVKKMIVPKIQEKEKEKDLEKKAEGVLGHQKHSSDEINEEIVGHANKDEEELLNILQSNIINSGERQKPSDKESKRIVGVEKSAREILDSFKLQMTTAEKLYEERKLKRLPEKIEKSIKATFKEKYQNYNKLLTKLPEHNDIPKVGPG